MAQAGHESNGFRNFKESLNFKWKELGTVGHWGGYFTPITKLTKIKKGKKKPDKVDPNNEKDPRNYKRSTTSMYVAKEKFANYVYNDKKRSSKNKLGNISKGDGYKYRGRGIFQLTGKYNYNEFTNFYQKKYNSAKSFVTNPELVASDTEIAVLSALWFFKKKVIDKLIIDSNTSVKKVSRKVNGGKKGLPHRRSLFKRAKINVKCH